MPQNRVFHIRDLQPDGPFMLSAESVRQECGVEAYDTFMKRMCQVHLQRNDYGAFEKPLDAYVDFRFFRTRAGGQTVLKLGDVFPALSSSWLNVHGVYAGFSPFVEHGSGKSNVCEFMLWAAVVGDKSVKRTGFPDTLSLGSKISSVRMPALSNAGTTISVSFGDMRDSMTPSVIVGVAFSVKKVCNGCRKIGTLETDFDAENYADARQFKKCGRCKNSCGISVWYCSRECQLAHYPNHRLPCKVFHEYHAHRMKLLDPALSDAPWVACQACGVRPCDANVWNFVQCPDCILPSFNPFVYCSEYCRSKHRASHRVTCTERRLADLTRDFINDFSDRLESAQTEFPEVFREEECAALRRDLDEVAAKL